MRYEHCCHVPELMVCPRQYSRVPTRNTAWAVEGVDVRAGQPELKKVQEDAAIDRYVFIRDGYQMHRQSLVFDGNPPRRKFYDDEE